jgi:O-antigen/teichoic acid export membrane protein
MNIFLNKLRFSKLSGGVTISESFWVVVGQAMSVGAGFVSMAIVSRALGPQNYGTLALYLSIAAGANQLVFTPMGGAASRILPIALEKEALSSFLSASLTAFLFGVLFVCAMYGCGTGIVVYLTHDVRFGLIGAVIFSYSVLTAGSTALSNYYNMLRSRFRSSFVAVCDAFFKVGLCIIAVNIFSATPITILLVTQTASFLAIMIAWLAWRRDGLSESIKNIRTIKLRNSWIRQIFDYGKPSLVWGVFTWAQFASERWALNLYGNREDVGIYSAVYQIGYYPISLMLHVMALLLLPIIFGVSKAGAAPDQIRSVRHGILAGLTVISGIAIPFIVLCTIFRVEIVSEVAGPLFLRHSLLLPILATASWVSAVAHFLSTHFMARMRLWSLTIVKVASGTIAVALNFIGANVGGATGVAIAVLASSVISALMMALLLGSDK